MKKFAKKLDVVQAIELEIIKIVAEENKNDLCVIVTEPSNANESGVWQLTYGMLNALAKDCGAASAEMLANAVNTKSIGGDVLKLNVRWVDDTCKIGVDSEGDDIINEKTGDIYFTEEHFRREGLFTGIELEEEAVAYVEHINIMIDVEEAKEMRKQRRKERKGGRSRKVATPEKLDLENVDPTDSGDDGEIDDLFGEGEETPKEEKKPAPKTSGRGRKTTKK
jgi:hypothetical protein